MISPLIGQIFERDGKRRHVVQIEPQGIYWNVYWTRTNSPGEYPRRCWCKTWCDWAAKATLVQEGAK